MVYFDFDDFKGFLNDILNPVEVWHYIVSTENVAELFLSFTFFLIFIIAAWGFLPVTIIIAFLYAIKLD